jgi:hypothetical protein
MNKCLQGAIGRRVLFVRHVQGTDRVEVLNKSSLTQLRWRVGTWQMLLTF